MAHVEAEQDVCDRYLQAKQGTVSQGAVLVRFTDAGLADESTLEDAERAVHEKRSGMQDDK